MTQNYSEIDVTISCQFSIVSLFISVTKV